MRRVKQVAVVRISRGRLVWMIALGLLTAAVMDALVASFLVTVYAPLMEVNKGAFDWAVPAFLGGVLALALFPWRKARLLPKWPALVVTIIAAISALIVTRWFEPPVAIPHPLIPIALAAFVVSITVKAMWGAIAARMPTSAELQGLAVSFVINAAGAAIFGAAGAAIGDAADVDFAPGGGSFGGGGASGSW